MRSGTRPAAARSASVGYGRRVLTVIRIALQVVLFFVLLSVLVGVVSAQTGAAEKAVLVGLAGALVWLASVVRRMGRRPQPL